MKYLFTLSFIAFSLFCFSQKQELDTAILDYFPAQRSGVDDQAYHRGTTILKNAYEQIKEDSGKMVYADHLNLATAFIKLKEPKEIVLNQWHLAQEEDLESTAEIFPMIYSSALKVKGYLSEDEYDSLIKKFVVITANKQEVEIDPTEYAINNGLDLSLVILMHDLGEKDQQFRMSDMSKQQLIDRGNMQIVDSLFQHYGKYIGLTLVGEEYQHAMWLVIQHADLKDQEKYLPIVHEGVKIGELPEVPLKMLIDRICMKKFGYQIFGSQSGGELADNSIIQVVKEEYGF